MSIALDILRTYRAPGEVVLRRSAGGPREDRALAILMGACILMFTAQWPYLARLSYQSDDLPQEGLISSSLLAWVFFAPLAFYAIAGLFHLIAKLFRGSGSWFDTRIAVFWGLLASTPLWLFDGLVRGFLGLGLESNVTGTLAIVVLLVFWVAGIWAVECRQKVE